MNELDLANKYQEDHTKTKRIKYILSFSYLIIGTLGVIGHISLFEEWPTPFRYLFLFSIPFYLAALSFTILIHPTICLIKLIKHKKKNQNFTHILKHLIWSLLIVVSYMIMLSNGYILTA